MQDVLELLRKPGATVAVVGASDDLGKYGARIYRDLKAKGFGVYAVNPGRDTVDGDPAYARLADLPEAPTVVDLVVPASVGLEIVKEAGALGYRNIFVQPGAESPELLGHLQEHGFNYIAHHCIMVETRLAG